MTGYRLAWIWAAALLLATGVLLLLARHGMDREQSSWTEIPGKPVWVIGSSLMLYAIPPEKEGPGLLGDGREHLRVGVSGITEEQLLEVFARALDADARTIIVEINPLAVDFADSPGLAHRNGWIYGVMAKLRSYSDHARGEIRILFGGSSRLYSSVGEAVGLDSPTRIEPTTLERIYPLRPRSPRHAVELEELLMRARARGTEVILIAPPRARSVAGFFRAQDAEALSDHFVRLSRRLGLPLFQPAAFWPDDHFIDQAHMNRKGRARLVLELARWRAARP